MLATLGTNLDPLTLIGILLAVCCVMILIGMALARLDESCRPERHCITCRKFDNDKPQTPECRECLSNTATLKHWERK